MAFPKKIYVREEDDNGSKFLTADKEISGENGDKVAIYELKEVKKLCITEKLV